MKRKGVEIISVDSNFEREQLRYHFGFKGGYLTELWQNVVQIKSKGGFEAIGMATQSVLYGDANVFASTSEAGGNALMYAVTNKALQKIVNRKFDDPIQFVDQIIPEVYEEAKQLTGIEQLNVNFIYNALLSVDNALWLLYAQENGVATFYDMLPKIYREALSHKNDKIAVMYQISYDMPLEYIKTAAEQGYFVFKVKTGFPGDDEVMLQKDMERLTEIHRILKDVKTTQTTTGKVYYTMDANARYPNKALLKRYLDHAKEIGAFPYIILYEEPFVEENDEDVSDLGVLIAADESVHSEGDAYRKIARGYKGFVLKGIAKTLSETLKIAKIAYEHSIPCLCADLTVNPILIDWNKNIAAALPPFPGVGMGLMETNGDMNYVNWDIMKARHPHFGEKWTEVSNGVFELGSRFYECGGGIFSVSEYYKNLFKR
ncbi:L-alanine-DL-glutamate epimerase [Sphingobacterium sp. SGG-5]|uniref:enolase C-terminal domain-like protein n=1 Tax=Sphingobacterium sp. SGG-5 TaxID=2710881 RepID=UPI0013EB430A|nr:enolase C-terminal domain-like protein [Sphingobacterium sp. SGG-5]NGM62250.1 L-alanine-DL-glutamate epimerase [Sphingobacterium sp. SGG-5]